MIPLIAQITVSHYLAVGAVLFVTGVLCMATKRNALGILMGIELVLNGANINFIAFSRYLGDETGQVFVFFILTVAAAEAAIGLGLIIALVRLKDTVAQTVSNMSAVSSCGTSPISLRAAR